MTAQVAILTSSCAVLAADSAVTISSQTGRKVYTGVEKIYPLSTERPLAALVYGVATLIDVPWATLLSEYRQAHGVTASADIADVARQLRTFLEGRLRGRIQRTREDMLRIRAYGLIRAIADVAREQAIEAVIESDASGVVLSSRSVADKWAELLSDIVKKERDTWAAAERLPSISASDEKRLHRKARPLIAETRSEALADVAMSAATSRAVADLALLSLTRQTPEGIESPTQGGIVLVGFADGEFWPSYIELMFDGIGIEGLRWWELDSDACGGPQQPVVRAFAQADGVQTMMDGVHPEMLRMIASRLIADGLDPRDLSKAIVGVQERWEEHRTLPILRTLDVMPPPDLCEVAESLVSITGLWQRMRGALETVGGTISVAVLAPGEPLRWAKRPDLSAS
jgi:hypothetical protein